MFKFTFKISGKIILKYLSPRNGVLFYFILFELYFTCNFLSNHLRNLITAWMCLPRVDEIRIFYTVSTSGCFQWLKLGDKEIHEDMNSNELYIVTFVDFRMRVGRTALCLPCLQVTGCQISVLGTEHLCAPTAQRTPCTALSHASSLDVSHLRPAQYLD